MVAIPLPTSPEQAQRTAAQLGLTEEDINAEIKAMRAQKRK